MIGPFDEMVVSQQEETNTLLSCIVIFRCSFIWPYRIGRAMKNSTLAVGVIQQLLCTDASIPGLGGLMYVPSNVVYYDMSPIYVLQHVFLRMTII
jgi:hypothetical protein